jgi:SAM-dependent methyltransferase
MKVRTSLEVEREYTEKYAPLLRAHEENDRLTLERIRELEVGYGEVQMSIGTKLCDTTRAEAMEISLQMHLDYIVISAFGTAASVVDLGCGYGYLLARLRPLLGRHVELRGGEISSSAVALAERLHRGDDLLSVGFFDFHNSRCGVLDAAKAPCVVVTSYALHQLATAAPAIRMLSHYASKIAAVVSLEPEEDFFGGSPLGKARLRYQREHDYSADLLRCVKDWGAEIETIVPNAVGANALLPGTLGVWRFA